MKTKKLKLLFSIIVFSVSSFLLNAQNSSSRKQVEDPSMLNKLQGTWMSIIPGEAMWYKVQIDGSECKVWISSPRTGHWNDGASFNDPTVCNIVGCYKITDRNEYDGKLQSENIALTNRRNGEEGYTLNLHLQGGKTYLRIMDKYGTKWRVCKKVLRNFSPWN